MLIFNYTHLVIFFSICFSIKSTAQDTLLLSNDKKVISIKLPALITIKDDSVKSKVLLIEGYHNNLKVGYFNKESIRRINSGLGGNINVDEIREIEFSSLRKLTVGSKSLVEKKYSNIFFGAKIVLIGSMLYYVVTYSNSTNFTSELLKISPIIISLSACIYFNHKTIKPEKWSIIKE